MEAKDYIIAKRPSGASNVGSDGLPANEDEYGNISISEETTIATFWGDVKEVKPAIDSRAGAITQTRKLEITADSRDTEAVDIGDIVTINNLNNSEFVVQNIFQSDWRWMNTIIVEYTSR